MFTKFLLLIGLFSIAVAPQPFGGWLKQNRIRDVEDVKMTPYEYVDNKYFWPTASSEEKEVPLRTLEHPNTSPTAKPKPKSLVDKILEAFRYLLAQKRSARFLSPEKRSEIIENWKMNRNKLILLWRYSQELSYLKLALREAIEYSTSVKENPSIHTFSNHLVKKLDAEFHPTLEFLVEQKVLELGSINLPNSKTKLMELLAPEAREKSTGEKKELPGDIVDEVIQKAWRSFGDSYVDKLKKVLSTDPLFQDLCEKLQGNHFESMWWRYTLTTLDFLTNNEFVNPSAVINFFQDETILKNLMLHIRLTFNNRIDQYFFLGSHLLTDHWMWPHLHYSFLFLSKESENTINAFSLIYFRYKTEVRSIHPPSLGLNEDWIDFLGRYLNKNLLEEWWKFPSRQLNMPSEVHNMIRLVATQDDRFLHPQSTYLRRIMDHICDALDFIDDHISKGLVSRELSNHPDHEEFDNRFKLIKISAKINALHLEANQIFRYISNNNTPYSFSPLKISKETFDTHVQKFVDLFNQYQAEFKRVYRKPYHSINSNFHLTIRRVIDYFEGIKEELLNKSNSLN